MIVHAALRRAARRRGDADARLRVARAARLGDARVRLRVEARLPFGESGLDVRAVPVLHVVTTSAHRRRRRVVEIEQRRIRRCVRRSVRRVRDRAAKHVVGRERQALIVGGRDGGHRVTEEARDAVQLRVDARHVGAVARRARLERERRVTLHAERRGRPGGRRLALKARVHRGEHGIIRRVRVHATRPLREVRRVTRRARLRVHELGLRHRRRIGRTAEERDRDQLLGAPHSSHVRRVSRSFGGMGAPCGIKQA